MGGRGGAAWATLATVDRPVLPRAMRGYDSAQVDALLDEVWPALSGSAGERASARELLDLACFTVVLRGYARSEVDDLVQRLKAELGLDIS